MSTAKYKTGCPRYRPVRIHGTLIVVCRFAHMSCLDCHTVEALIFAAFGILFSLSGIASLWAFRNRSPSQLGCSSSLASQARA